MSGITRWAIGLLALLGALVSPAGAQPTDLARVSATLGQSALRAGDTAVLAVVVDIKDGYHAQSATPSNPNFIAFDLRMLPDDRLVIGAPLFPKGHDVSYPALGNLNVYDGRVVVYVPIRVKADASPGPVELKGELTFQICDDQVCFAPENPPVLLKTEIVAATAPVTPSADTALFSGFDPSVFATLSDATAATRPAAGPSRGGQTIFGLALTQNTYTLAFAGAFVVGIIFNVVPCVLPVLPLKAIGFYEVAQHDRAKCFAFGLAFSAGIIATFAALAIPVLVMKSFAWGELFGNPWFAAIITLVLVGMALGMFGLFGVNVPTWLYSVTPRHDTFTGNVLFGILTAILSTPCTFGLFFALLTWAATQPALVGVALLMVVGAGMASPYLLLSAFPQLAAKVPRGGAWSDVVKQMMGFLLLATAAYFGKMFLPESLRGPNFWWVIFALVAASGLFLIVRAIQIARRPAAIAVAAAIALALVGPAFAVTLKLANPPVQWISFTDDALQTARDAGKPVLVKFTADWCANCQTIELTVFGSEETARWLRQNAVTPIKADLTFNTAPGWPLLRSLSAVGAIPVTAVYRPGEDQPRILTGIYSTADLKAAIEGR